MGDDELRIESELPKAAVAKKKPRKTSPQSKSAQSKTTTDPGASAAPDREQIKKPAPKKQKKTGAGKKEKPGGATPPKPKKETVNKGKSPRKSNNAVLKIEPIKIEIEIIGSPENNPPTGQAEILQVNAEDNAKPAEIGLTLESHPEEPAESPPPPTGQAEMLQVNAEDNARPAEIGLTLESHPEKPAESPPPLDSIQAIPDGFTATAKVGAKQVVALQIAAIKVRNIVAVARDIRTDIIQNKVIVQGILHEQVFYVGTDNLVHHLSDDFHFSTFLDIPGAQPGMHAEAAAIVEDVIAELAPDGLSLVKKIVLEIFVKVTESVQLNLTGGTGPVLLLNQVIGENTAQTLIENDLPLTSPAIKIDEITGSICNLVYEIINDKVIIQGVLHKQIFYIDTANLERHQGEDIPFSLFVDLPGATPGMDIVIDARIEAILFNLTTATLLHQKAVLAFFVKVTERVQQQVATGIGPLFKVEEFIAANTAQHLSETLVTLSLPAVKIREIVATLRNLTSHVITDKVIVQGAIHKQIYFIGSDNIEHHQAEDVPFSLFLDIPGAEPNDRVHLESRIEAVFFELLSSLELRQKVILAITVTIARESQLNLEVGTGTLYKLEEVIGENTTQVLLVRREIIPPPVPVLPVVISDPVVFPGGRVIGSQQTIVQNTFPLATPAIEIKGVQGVARGVTYSVIHEEVLVRGTLESEISLIDPSNIVRKVSESAPFSIMVNIPGLTPDQKITATVNVENISCKLTNNGTAVTQMAVLQAVVEAVNGDPGNIVYIVTQVTGPGIVTTAEQVEAFLQTATGPVYQQFSAVTNVSGPGIKNVIKQLVPLKKVGDTRVRLLDVVTKVEIA